MAIMLLDEDKAEQKKAKEPVYPSAPPPSPQTKHRETL
jgi:hypothetical protein